MIGIHGLTCPVRIWDFHPHQIRHTAGTRVRSVFDLETAKAVLGHSDINTTGIYAEIDLRRAIEAAAKMG